MSGLSNSQKSLPRTLASDISTLFRSVSTAPQQETKAPTSVQKSSLPVRSKKIITRIQVPLLRLTHKKSTQSALSGQYTNLKTGIIRGPTDVCEIFGRPPSPDPRLPSSPSAPEPSSRKPPSPSFTSAQFLNSQSKTDLPLDSRTSSSRTPSILSPSSSGCERTSTESGSSTIRNRSTTPRGARPLIMVSTMDEVEGLFTQETPVSKVASKPSGNSQASHGTHESSPRSTPETIYRRGQTPASVLAATVRDQQALEQRSSASSKNSRRTDYQKGGIDGKDDGKATTGTSSARESPRLDQMTKSQPNRPSRGSLGRSRMRLPSSVAQTKPPSIPLPDIPTDNPSTKPDGTDPSDPTPRLPDARSVRQSRSNATSISGAPTASSPSASPQDRSGSRALDPFNGVSTTSPNPRRALRPSDKQFENLAAYVLGREEAWLAEKKSLEEKINTLRQDLVRRDSEITGLKLIINRDDEDFLRRPTAKPPFGIPSQPQGCSIHSPSRRMIYQSDPGPESTGSSENDLSSSVIRPKKGPHRTLAIVGEDYRDKTPSGLPHCKRLTVSVSASSGPNVTRSPSSSSSMSSSSSRPANNVHSIVKRGRPSPISDSLVLGKSPSIDGILEMLRPFA